MISEHQEEEACLYVLGLLPVQEHEAYEKDLASNPELAELTRQLHNATLAIAVTAPKQALPAGSKDAILKAFLAERAKLGGTTPPSPQESNIRRWPTIAGWATAACLTGLLAWQWQRASYLESGWKSTTEDLARAETAGRETLENSKRELAEVRTQQAAAESERMIWEQKAKDADVKLGETEADRKVILAKLTEIEQQNLVSKAQIAILGSLLKDRPQAVAVSLWDQTRQNGVLVVENLPKLAPGKDYQLWVIDPSIAAPVSAGVFKVDAAGKVRIEFKPTQAIQKPGKFAVTIEKEGGVASPTMDQMVVIGGL